MRGTSFPTITLLVALAVLGVFALELSGDGQALCAAYGFTAAHPSFETALSSLFLHSPSDWMHIAGNLVVLLLVGSRVEGSIGSLRFGALFVAGGVAGAALHTVVDPTSLVPLVGCSGSLFAILAVAAVLYGPGMLAFVAVLAVVNIAHALGAPGDAGVSFGAHIGGLALGVCLTLLGRVRAAALASV